MLVGGANLLARTKDEIDSLNVFPVPDGDTGTNMYYTLRSGVKEAYPKRNSSIGVVAEALANGSLLGARGNSGVILSQIIAGFAEAMAGKERGELSDVEAGFRRGIEKACEAISDPVEGTIITVGRELAGAYGEAVGRTRDLVRATVWAYNRAKEALDKTPELLPVLKEAGVVDAGGKGLVVIFEGIIKAMRDAALSQDIELFDVAVRQQKEFVSKKAQKFGKEIEHTYCSEFIVTGNNIPLDILRQELIPYGDCLMVVGDSQTAKVHIHSNHPGLVLECGLRYGALKEIHINNMEEQMEARFEEKVVPEVEKPLGIVAVGVGEGMINIMASLGVDMVVRGGQTMNPSAQELLDAVKDTPAEKIILLPNNKNVILAAEQAKSLADKEVIVLPARSMVQGVAALLAFNSVLELDENLSRMQSAIDNCAYGEVTVAVRDSKVKGIPVKKGEYMAMARDELIAADVSMEEVLKRLIDNLSEGEPELITLYYGADLSEDEARGIQEKLESKFSEAEFELHYGGQPVYPFLVSVE